MRAILAQIDRWIEKFCTSALFASLLAMIVLTIFSMVLRWFSQSMLWIEPLVRHLVFTCAFLGGVVATGKNKHIAIDLVSRILDNLGASASKKVVDRLISVFCLISAIWLAYAGTLLVEAERHIGQEKFLGIHSSHLAATIPVGLALIAFRYIVRIVDSFIDPQQ
jgi:TRAP-type C4-dicarboxylate transport system permease small subunit